MHRRGTELPQTDCRKCEKEELQMQNSPNEKLFLRDCLDVRSSPKTVGVHAFCSDEGRASSEGVLLLDTSSGLRPEWEAEDLEHLDSGERRSGRGDIRTITAFTTLSAAHGVSSGVGAGLHRPHSLPQEKRQLLSLNEKKVAPPKTQLPAPSPEAPVADMENGEMSFEAAGALSSSSTFVHAGKYQVLKPKAATPQTSPGSEFRRCCSAGVYNKSGSAVSFLEEFHRRQRILVSSEQKRRDEALHTLKYWRGGAKPSETPPPEESAATSAGLSRRSHDRASRRQVVGEMAALFSNLCLRKQQRGDASHKHTIAQLEHQCRQVAELIQRLSLAAPVPKARGALVKARSLQLQLHQQEQRKHRRLPPHLLLPLPSYNSKTSNGKHRQDTDPWRRLLRQVRPRCRRASAPPFAGLLRDPIKLQTAAAAVSSAAPTRVASVGRAVEQEAGSVTKSAAIAESARQDAAAAAVVAEFTERVDRFASRHRSASMGWGGPRKTLVTGPKMTKELGGELLQQAEVCCAAVADAPAAWRKTLIGALETFSRTLKVQLAKCQQRPKIRSVVEKRQLNGDFPASICGKLISEPEASTPGWSTAAGKREARAEAKRERAAADAAAEQARRPQELASVPDSGAPSKSMWAELYCSPEQSVQCSKEKLTNFLSSEFAEDDSSLLDAETDCEYLLGRQLLPYERMLLKYRMLRRNASADVSKTYGETAEAQLVEQLLQVMDDGSTLPGDTATPEDDVDLWAFWGDKGENEAAKIEHLLGMVGELQEADMQQHTHVRQSLLPTQDSMSNEERMLRSFFEQEDNSEGSASELKAANSEAPAELPSRGQGRGYAAESSGARGPAGESSSFSFPTAERLYRAHYLVGPWRANFSAYPPPTSRR